MLALYNSAVAIVLFFLNKLKLIPKYQGLLIVFLLFTLSSFASLRNIGSTIQVCTLPI